MSLVYKQWIVTREHCRRAYAKFHYERSTKKMTKKFVVQFSKDYEDDWQPAGEFTTEKAAIAQCKACVGMEPKLWWRVWFIDEDGEEGCLNKKNAKHTPAGWLDQQYAQ